MIFIALRIYIYLKKKRGKTKKVVYYECLSSRPFNLLKLPLILLGHKKEPNTVGVVWLVAHLQLHHGPVWVLGEWEIKWADPPQPKRGWVRPIL